MGRLCWLYLLVLFILLENTEGFRSCASVIRQRGHRVSRSALYDILSVFGGPKVEIEFPGGIQTIARTGEKMEKVTERAQYKDCKFVCREGWCSSCEHLLDGKKVRLCRLKVPKAERIQIEKYNWEEDPGIMGE